MSYTNGLDKPSDYFNTITWTGDGTTKDITGVGFQPDWVWAKKRSATGFNALADSVRGGTKNIFTNSSGAEETSATDWILSFASDGFGVNSGGNLNQSSATYVAWNWLADNTSGSSNTDGSITSTVSANTTSGFSIVSFTSTGSTSTVGHGLGVTPDIYIIKNRSAVEPWFVYTTKIDGSLDYLRLNQADGKVDFGLSAPTSSVFSTDNGSNGNNIIAYCFAEKKGFSKFGSYTGNGNTDGTFVYTGFKPAWVMTKRTDSISSWDMHDTKRDTYNVASKHLLAEDSGAEGNTAILDILSNGFKFRSSNGDRNASGGTYIYMAFAENPFTTSTGIPTTAR